MGRYSRKDMLEFANFAKCFQSPRKVEDAYDVYLKGARIFTSKTDEEVVKRIKKIKNEGRIRRQNEKKLRKQNKSSVTS